MNLSISDIFAKFDKNKDGKISCEEFRDAIHALSPTIPSDKLVVMFNQLDTNGDGKIDAAEFASCMDQIVKLYDIDCDGKISANELYVVMTGLGEKCTVESCMEMVRAFDADGDGCISFEEFKTLMYISK
ncbi:putative calcium-binding protein CML33 [Raphanus sativus]|nr:putative calcium-binding protein CML33 [Raphanus sativus]KAJ4886263.1 putative calcium-binding protein CML33 [Raphanus sativus]